MLSALLLLGILYQSCISETKPQSLMVPLPNVTHVGMNTLGILSGILNKSLGKYHITCSNQRLLTKGGDYYEKSGVPPEILLEVFSVRDPFNSHMQAVNHTAELIQEKKH